MPTVIFREGLPLTEADFLALDVEAGRIELLDGSLLASPAPTPHHQYVSHRLAECLWPGGRTVLTAVPVRLRPNRITVPDLVVTGHIDFHEPVIDAARVRLVCEIVSPSNASTDRVLKMHYYAAAGIPWYLIVEQETGTLYLYELDGDKHLERSVTDAGGTLHLTDPVEVSITAGDLLPLR